MGGSVNISDLGKWPKVLISRYHADIVDAIRLSVRMNGPMLIQWSIAAVKPHQPVNTGDYKRNWKTRNITDGARFYNPTVQAGIIERGRRPGFGVSKQGREAIERWVHLHGMDKAPMSKRERATRRRMRKAGADKSAFKNRKRWQAENRAAGIAFLIARAIKQRGLPAKNVLGQIEQELKDRVFDAVSATIAKGPK